eukprot:scaffold18372_cov101-Phaeocystis_antarctica.AAC.1
MRVGAHLVTCYATIERAHAIEAAVSEALTARGAARAAVAAAAPAKAKRGASSTPQNDKGLDVTALIPCMAQAAVEAAAAKEAKGQKAVVAAAAKGEAARAKAAKAQAAETVRSAKAVKRRGALDKLAVAALRDVMGKVPSAAKGSAFEQIYLYQQSVLIRWAGGTAIEKPKGDEATRAALLESWAAVVGARVAAESPGVGGTPMARQRKLL